MPPIKPRSSEPPPAEQPALSDKQLALVVYILYLVAYFNGLSALIGVIIAHIKVGGAGEFMRSHYQFQIRTFWIGMVYLAIGLVLLAGFIGVIVLIWFAVFTLVRNVKGLLALNDNKPIQHPDSWFFG
jgi:uncharacterized membrane protein